MPLMYGSYLAGSLLSTLVPVALLICFAVFFYRQAHRQKTVAESSVAETKPATPEPPARPDEPQPYQ